MLRSLIGILMLLVALFWVAVWIIAGIALMAAAWIAVWIIVLCLDYHLYRDSSPRLPPPPVVMPEIVEGELEP